MNDSIYDSSDNILFGELLQCQLIMEKNFEGKHCMIQNKGKPDIDCMFFPATLGDEVEVYPNIPYS